MTANTFGAQWLGKHVAVCDPDPPPTFGTRPLPDRERRFDGQQLLKAGRIREQLLSRLKEAGLLNHPVWSPVFDGVQAGEPVLVQRLDRPDSYYWIVPAVDGRGGLRAAVGIDARFGDYQQAIAVRDRDAGLFAFADPKRIVEHVRDRRFELPKDGGRLHVRPEGLCIHPALVWRPCRESLSPFYPFRMLSVGAQRLFVRVFDGAVFTTLSADTGGI
jgi:hypothetical protein